VRSCPKLQVDGVSRVISCACHGPGYVLVLGTCSTTYLSICPNHPFICLFLQPLSHSSSTSHHPLSLVLHPSLYINPQHLRPLLILFTMKGLLGLSVLPLLAAGSPVLVESIHNQAAPIYSSTEAKDIPDSYIVSFKKHVTEDVAASHHEWVRDLHESTVNFRPELRKRGQYSLQEPTTYGGLRHTYNISGGFTGYSGHFHEDFIEQLRRNPDVSTSQSTPTTSR